MATRLIERIKADMRYEFARLHELSDDARLVVSEPLGDLRGAWHEVPEASYVVVRGGDVETHPFTPVVA